MHSILSSRVLLNLRQAAAAPAFIETAPETNVSYRNSAVIFEPFATFFATGRDDDDDDAHGEETGTSGELDGVALRDIRRSEVDEEGGKGGGGKGRGGRGGVDGPLRKGLGPTFTSAE